MATMCYSYRGYHPQYFFWRTYDGQEIDLLELDNKQHLQALECKWQTRKEPFPKLHSHNTPFHSILIGRSDGVHYFYRINNQ